METCSYEESKSKLSETPLNESKPHIEKKKNQVFLEGYVDEEQLVRGKSLTDEDLEELKGCLDLGFGFSYDEIPELCNTLPALELCYSMSRKFLHEHQKSPSGNANWKISSPAFNWTKRIPARTDTEEKIKKLLAIPIIERTFRFTPSEVVEDSADSSAGMSTGSHEVASEFALSDLKGLLAMGSVVKSEDVKQLEYKPSASKPRIPTTRSKTTSSKKRKIAEPIDLDLFENMEIPEILNKMQTFLTLGMDKIITALVDSEKKFEEAQEKIADLVRLGEMRMAYSNKVDQELALLKQESEGAKVKHQQELATLVEKAKRSAAVSILQSRLEMVEEASKEGFVSKAWDTKAWSATLQSLTGEKVNKVVKDVAKAAVDDASKVDKENAGEKKTAGDAQDDDGCAAKA